MKVKIAETEFEIKNTLPDMKLLVLRINEVMQENKSYLSHLIVDDAIVADDPLDYVKQNRKYIKVVEVILTASNSTQQKTKMTKSSTRDKIGPMQVTISNIVFEVKRTIPDVKTMFSKIDEAMSDFGVYFSHLVIDGVEVTDAPQEYVVKNIKNISNIEVAFLSQDQYFGQVVSIMNNFIEKAAPSLKEVADEFYGKPDSETWDRFEACINGISSLLGIINSLVAAPEITGKAEAIAVLGESIGLHLENLHTAAKLNDFTLMADILNFELVKFLEKLHDAVNELARSQNYATH